MKARKDLRLYQAKLARKLYRGFRKGLPGGLLAVEMSLGKTVTVGTFLRDYLDTTMGKVLIVAPLPVAQMTWPNEFREWKHLQPIQWKSLCGTVVGANVTAKHRTQWLNEFLSNPGSEVAIINRENVVWLYKELQKRKMVDFFDVLIYDESSRLKGGSKRASSSKRMSEFGAVCKLRQHMDFVIELTGTPTPNGLIDLWGQFYVIDQGRRLGTTKEAFFQRWFDTDYMGWNKEPKENAEDEIMQRCQGIMLSLKADDVIDLPPEVHTNHWVDLSKKEMQTYKRLERELGLEEHDIEAVNKGVLTFKLLQYANGSVYRYDEDNDIRDYVQFHTRKLAMLESIVEETNGANLLVAYSFKFDLELLKKKFKFARTAKEPSVLEDWNAGKVRMLLAHPASMAHGLNLQFGGHHAVWYGLNPSLELYQQFNARLPRPGQKSDHVFIRHILARGTYDEKQLANLHAKDATQDRITDAVKWHLGVKTN